MRVGYARVSTVDQNLDRQLDALKNVKCNKIFADKVSGKNTDRPQFKAMMDFVREGDEVFVLSLDRLSRNSIDITSILETFKHRGVMFQSLDLPDFSAVTDPNLRMMLSSIVIEVFKFTSQNERERIKERQREGIRLAKRRGAYRGKARQYSPTGDAKHRFIYQSVVNMIKDGVPLARIAHKVGISRSSVYLIKRYSEEEKE